MTTRRLHGLPQEWAGPAFALLTLIRDATCPTEPPALVQAWVAETTAMHRPAPGTAPPAAPPRPDLRTASPAAHHHVVSGSGQGRADER